MAELIDRKLDTEYLAKQLGCKTTDAPGGSKKVFPSDDDLRKFFHMNPGMALVEARFRDSQYTIIVAPVKIAKASSPKKKVAKKPTKKKAAKKKKS